MEKIYVEAFEKYRHVLGEDHPTTLNFMISLASHHIEAGRFDQAEVLVREALEKTDAHAPEFVGRKFLLKTILTKAGKVQPEFVGDAHAGSMLSRKDENRIHRDWVNPWILQSARKPIQLQTTVRYDQARRLLVEGEDTYDRITDLVKVEPRLEEPTITLYLPSGMEEYNSIGDAIGDEKSSSYAVFYLDESPEGCPVSVTYSVGNDEGQVRFTGGLVRHAVVEQYLNRINEKGEIPAWFVKGQAAKMERCFHPEYIQWSVQEALLPLGGFIELPRFFDSFGYSAHEIHMAGMVCAFLESPSLNEGVKSAYDRVLESISNQKHITTNFRALEKALMEDEKNIKAFMAGH